MTGFFDGIKSDEFKALAETHRSENEACTWAEDQDGIWNSTCNNAFVFNDGGPDENSFTFCPYCGRKLAAVYDAEPAAE